MMIVDKGGEAGKNVRVVSLGFSCFFFSFFIHKMKVGEVDCLKHGSFYF